VLLHRTFLRVTSRYTLHVISRSTTERAEFLTASSRIESYGWMCERMFWARIVFTSVTGPLLVPTKRPPMPVSPGGRYR
jgi:hypothetical protein